MKETVVTVERAEPDDQGLVRMVVSTNLDFRRDRKAWASVSHAIDRLPRLISALESARNALESIGDGVPIDDEAYLAIVNRALAAK